MAMKRMLMHAQNLLAMNAVVVSFFFHSQGVDLQKSLLGLYRALLHQLYPHFLDEFSDLTYQFQQYRQLFGQGRQDVDWSWMIGEIRKNFLKGISNATKRKSIVLFIDAVDEAGESSAKEVFRDLQQLLSSLSDCACQLRLCLSCRHYPEIILESGETLVMEDLNREDMEKVVNTRIDDLRIFNDSEKHQIKADVLKKSGGIFQWTSLVVDRIVHERTQGNSFQAVLEAMERVPVGLDFLYKALLETGDQQCFSGELKLRRALFQWVLFTTRPLSPKELQHALALSQDKEHSSIHEYESSSEFILVENYATRIKTLSKGLIHLKGPFDSGQVEFIHQSVVDFLTNRGGLRLFSGASEIEPIRLAHFEISRSCLRYLFMAEIDDMLRRLPEKLMGHRKYDGSYDSNTSSHVSRVFPLISYAWAHWIFHAVHAKGQDDETGKYSDDDILEAFQWPNDQIVTALWAPLHDVLGSPLSSWLKAFRHDTPFTRRRYERYTLGLRYEQIVRWPTEESRLMHLFAFCGLLDGSVQKRMISQVSSLESSRVKIPTTLAYAIIGQQKHVVHRLIAAGVNSRYGGKDYRRSPIHLASVWGDVQVLSLLIGSGVDSASYTGRFAPLHLAAAFGNRNAVEILLGAGAKINSKNSRRETPLHLASCYGQCEVSQYLLEHGADDGARTFRGDSPLFVAVDEYQQETIRILRRYGARVENKSLFKAIDTKRLDIIRALLEHDFNAGTKSKSRDKALFIVMKNNEQEIAKVLIAAGANVNAISAMRDGLGTPLHSAVEDDGIERVQFLLGHGADPNMKSLWTKTPLDIAMTHANHKIGRLLLEAGANPNLKDGLGETALMQAAGTHSAPDLQEKLEAVKLLLQFGADPTARNSFGETARSRLELQSEMDEFLRDAGVPSGDKARLEVAIPLLGLTLCWFSGSLMLHEFRQKIWRR